MGMSLQKYPNTYRSLNLNLNLNLNLRIVVRNPTYLTPQLLISGIVTLDLVMDTVPPISLVSELGNKLPKITSLTVSTYHISLDRIPAFDTFNTTEAIVPQFAISQNWNSLAYYPFDGYRILMRVWATAPSGDVNLLGAPLPVIKVFSVDSPTGLPVQSGSWDVEDDSGDMVATEVIFKISRHDVVKAFAMIIFFVNWGLVHIN